MDGVSQPYCRGGAGRANICPAAPFVLQGMQGASDIIPPTTPTPTPCSLPTLTTALVAFASPCLSVLQGVQGISDIITIPGLVNVDFADVKAIMSNRSG